VAEVISFWRKGASASLTRWGNGVNVLANVYSCYPGQGNGSALLQQVAEYADAHQIEILLSVQEFRNPNGSLNNQQLEAFYEKYGFERITDIYPIRMVRKPQSQESQSL
jgi:GNAT superfamily N-acetyltransferase